MLDTQDIALLRGMFSEILKINNDELKREIRDEMHSLIKASEIRITENISSLLDESVLPQIAELQRDMTMVKKHLQLA